MAGLREDGLAMSSPPRLARLGLLLALSTCLAGNITGKAAQ
jgi:hypothetical protein